MKKLILLFILILIAGALILYFGWVNIQPGYFGVAVSTINGTKNYPLESGKFYWFWEKLIPKTFKLYLVEKRPKNIKFSYNSILPGGENLSEYGDFEISLEGNLNYTIDFESTRYLIQKGIFQKNEDFFKEIIKQNLYRIFSDLFIEYFKNKNTTDNIPDYNILIDIKNTIINSILKDLQRYKLKDASIVINFTKIPPINIYVKAIDLYMEYMNSLYNYKKEKLVSKSATEAKIDKLREYGKLLKEYPDILKYLYIKNLSDNVEIIVMPQGKSGFPEFLEPEKNITKKNFIPVPELPEKIIPEEKVTPEKEVTTPEKKVKPEEKSSSIIQSKKKWYEYLMFWKYLGTKKQKDNSEVK